MKSHVPFLIRHFRWVLLCGLLVTLTTPYTAIAFTLLFLGACGGTFQKFGSERGLWMLSAFFAAMTGVILGCFIVGTCKDVAHHRIFNDGLALQIEGALTMLLFLYQFVFLAKITWQNWAVSKRRRRPELRIPA